MNIDDRYDRDHFYGEVKFFLSNYLPDVQECRFLLMKIIEQTIRDYCSLSNAELSSDCIAWEEAQGFLFDDEYKIAYGDLELNLEDVLDILDLDISWFREQVKKKFEMKGNQHGK